jgi:hypothetical protein
MGKYWERFKQLPPGRKFEVILAVGVTVVLLVMVVAIVAVSYKPPAAQPAPSPSATVTPTVIFPTFPLTLTPLTPTSSPTFDPLHPSQPTQVSPTPTTTFTRTSTVTATWFLTSFPSSTLVPWPTWTRTRTVTRTPTVTRTRTLTRTVTETPTVTQTLTATLTPTPTITSTPRPQRIAFTADQDGDGTTGIYTINPDGTSLVTVVQESGSTRFWDWSPDGKWMLAQDENILFKIRPDGTDWSLITMLATSLDAQGVWSPDGSYIVYRDTKDGKVDLFRIDPSGSGLAQLTSNPEIEICPALAPRKSGVYFILQNMPQLGQDGLFYKSPDFPLSAQAIEGKFECLDFNSNGFNLVISRNQDGAWNLQSGVANLVPGFEGLTYQGNNFSPSYSGDYSKIVFLSDQTGSLAITIMNSDGSGNFTVPNTPSHPQNPRWMP